MPVPVTLQVVKGDEIIATREFDRDIIKIGRLSSAHLCLDDEKVSRIHSVIEVAADGVMSIIDMGSVEGTFVNGKKVNKGVLAHGDEIRVGNTVIRVATQGAAAAVAPTVPNHVSTTVAIPDPRPAVPPPAAPRNGTVQIPPAVNVATPAVEAASIRPSPVQPEMASTLVEEAPAPRSRPARKKGSGPLGLELRFRWGNDQIVAEHFIRPEGKESFFVGSDRGVDFLMGDAKLGTPRFEVVRADPQSGFQVRFTGKMKGELHRNEQVKELKQIIESGKANHDGDAYSLNLDSNDYAWIDLGNNITLEVFFQPAPKPVLVPFLETVDFTVLNTFLVMFFLGALFVITALHRSSDDEYSDELNSNNARIAKLIIKPPEIQKNPFIEKLARQKAKGEIAAKHRGEEGQMGKKDGPKRNAHAAPKGDPNNKDTARMITDRIFKGGGGGISTIFGKNGLGGELKSAMGNMFGSAPGDAQGFGGLGLRGSAGGGGGVGDTIGIGGVGTKGRGGGTGSYGTGVGTLGAKKGSEIGITSTEPEVVGSLDKELIRQVIRRNINQIRYCYESQLTRFPKLSGKVNVKFVISAMGSVASSQVAQSTAGNAELETCVAGRVRTWIFPKPKGGGVVVVTYPFVFKPSGE